MAIKGKEKQCVAIATDVLAQLKAKKLKPKNMEYLGGEGAEQLVGKSGDLKKLLKKVNKPCEVCAVGALFIGAVNKYDEFELGKKDLLSTDGFFNKRNMQGKLQEFFTEQEIDTMEGVFEGWKQRMLGCQKLASMNHDWDRPIKTLQFIMKQVIAQKGHFNARKAEKVAPSFE